MAVDCTRRRMSHNASAASIECMTERGLLVVHHAYLMDVHCRRHTVAPWPLQLCTAAISTCCMECVVTMAISIVFQEAVGGGGGLDTAICWLPAPTMIGQWHLK
jgi:hypothetical protein